MLCTYNRPYLLATIILMWIGSRIRLMARQPYASPPGYQSPASGDNIPDPGSQDTTGAQPYHGSTPPSASHNNDNLINSTPYPLHSCARQEVSNANLVSHSLTSKIQIGRAISQSDNSRRAGGSTQVQWWAPSEWQIRETAILNCSDSTPERADAFEGDGWSTGGCYSQEY